MKHLHTVSVAKADVSNNTIPDVIGQYLGFLTGTIGDIITGFINDFLNSFKA